MGTTFKEKYSVNEAIRFDLKLRKLTFFHTV